jgi:hypothetical protein
VKSISLSADLTRYLRSADFLDQDLREIIAKHSDEVSKGGSILSLDDDIAERVREVFTERLAQAGFRSDYGLSPEGADLEELIDRFAG